MTTLRIAGQDLFYETFGAGDPVLLMHGWIQTGRHLHSLAAQPAHRRRVIVPDLPCCGCAAHRDPFTGPEARRSASHFARGRLWGGHGFDL
jgi:pimeloyl-ACP methyl ester carboxylesterase